MTTPPLFAAFVAAAAYGVGAVFQSIGAKRGGGGHGLRGLLAIARQPLYMAGLALDLVGWVLMIYAVRHLPLFAVQTVLASSLVVTAALGWVVLHARMRPADIGAIAVAIVGLVLVGVAADPEEAHPPTRAVKVFLVVLLPILAISALATARHLHPVVVAVLAGMLFSLGSTCVRSLADPHSFTDLVRQPLTWAVIGYSGTALAVHARALERGRVGAITAAMWATEIVTAATVGFLLLGDRVRPAARWSAGLGMVFAVGATIVLAQSHGHDVLPTAAPRPDDPAAHPDPAAPVAADESSSPRPKPELAAPQTGGRRPEH